MKSFGPFEKLIYRDLSELKMIFKSLITHKYH